MTCTKKETVTVKLNRKDLIRYFIGEAPKKLHIPSGATNVKLFVVVPGGGDYSNMELDIDSDCPVVLQYDIFTE